MLGQLMFGKISGLHKRQAGSEKAELSGLASAGAEHERFVAVKKTSLEPKSDRSGPAPMIGVLGAKGGSGSTTLAANLAIALSAEFNSTILLDADFRQPDLGQVLAIEPEHSLSEFLARGADVDAQVLNACCAPIADSNCRLMAPPEDGSLAVKASLTDLARGFSRVRNESDLWVVDLPKQLDKHFVTFIDSCDRILLVFEATVPAVAACQRWLKVFAELGYEQDRIVCVLNRAGSKFSGVEAELKQCFAHRVFLKIPNASALVWDCSTKGQAAYLAQPKHQYSRAVAGLAEYLSKSIR